MPCSALAVSIWCDSTIPNRKFLAPLQLGFKVTSYDEVTQRYQTFTNEDGTEVSWEYQLTQPPVVNPDYYDSLRVWRFMVPISKSITFTHERVLMVELNKLTSYLYQGKYGGLTVRIELVPEHWDPAVSLYCGQQIGTAAFLASYFPVGIYHGGKGTIGTCKVFSRAQWKKEMESKSSEMNDSAPSDEEPTIAIASSSTEAAQANVKGEVNSDSEDTTSCATDDSE